MALNDIASLLLKSQPITAQQSLPQPAMMPEPFTWGSGGARITPDELARRRQMADAEMQGNYSPVGSWAEGLGRVADGVLGGLETRRLNKADEANAAYSDKIAQALLGGDASGAGSAMIDPYASPQVQGLAKMMWERANPKPVNNDTVADYGFIASKLGPAAADDWLRRKGDPIVTTTLPGDRFYSGPQSQLLTAITGGGGPASGAAGAPAPASPSNVPLGRPTQGWPPAEAIMELQQNPGTAAQFDEVFGRGMAAKILGK